MRVEDFKDFIEIPITQDIMEEAAERDRINREKYGRIKTRRVDKPFQRMIGYIAEVAVKRTFDKLSYSDNNHYDFTGKIKDRELTFDSKANSCKSVPRVDYDASIYDEGNFKSDIYIISRVMYIREFNQYLKLWITGFITQKDFINKREFVEKGTQRYGYVCDDDRFEIKYTSLHKPKDLIDILC